MHDALRYLLRITRRDRSFAFALGLCAFLVIALAVVSSDLPWHPDAPFIGDRALVFLLALPPIAVAHALYPRATYLLTIVLDLLFAASVAVCVAGS